jgi:hypothetical protein
MSPIYVPGKVVLRKGWQPMDADAAAYITAVETADGQALEERTKIAIDNFVLGCKADGIWTAIKASCILAGARTLAGALVPLVGTAPTNNNFVSGDYNRKTGLVGNGSTKYLNALFNPISLTTLSLATFVSVATSVDGVYIGAVNTITSDIRRLDLKHASFLRATNTNNDSNRVLGAASSVTGFVGASLSGTTHTHRSGQAIYPAITVVQPDPNVSLAVFARNTTTVPSAYTNARLAFYSIGESLNLALLDARVTTLINAFAAAIP